MDLKNSASWEKEFPEIVILDPDGWDRSSALAFLKSWSELITREEFLNRVCKSTVQLSANFFNHEP